MEKKKLGRKNKRRLIKQLIRSKTGIKKYFRVREFCSENVKGFGDFSLWATVPDAFLKNARNQLDLVKN